MLKGNKPKVTVRSTKNKSQPPSQPPDVNNPPGSYLGPPPPAYFNTPFYNPFYGHMSFPTFGGLTNTPARPGYSRAVHPQIPQFTPGSDSIDEINENVTLFPKVATWLQGLDDDERRGHDGHNFAQYAAKLEAQMFVRVLNMEKLSKDELISICDNMPIGTASLICEYARKDCNAIRKTALRNIRERRLELKHYD